MINSLVVFVKSIFAGIAISLGCMLYLACENRYVGAALFSIGLIAVLVFDLELYTGRVCYLNKNIYEWPIVLAGNYLGTQMMYLLNRNDLQAIMSSKYNKTYLELYADAIVCGMCVAIAVKGYRKTYNLIIPILGVMTFILVGGEHCVADMFYSSGRSEFLLQLFTVTLGNTIGGMVWGEMTDK